MDNKTGIIAGCSLFAGLLIGFGAGYSVTKKFMEDKCQQAIDEMKVSLKKEIQDIKEASKNENNIDKQPESEDEVVKIDKPSITEISSIVNSGNNNYTERTQYNINAVKEAIKNQRIAEAEAEKSKKEKKEQTVVDYSIYNELPDSSFEKEFTFDSDTNTWQDYEHVAYNAEDLPFDPEDVIWDDNDQCYIHDKSNNSIYILEKV